MDSIIIYGIDRICRIYWTFHIPGFRMKPGMPNPLRDKGNGCVSRFTLRRSRAGQMKFLNYHSPYYIKIARLENVFERYSTRELNPITINVPEEFDC